MEQQIISVSQINQYIQMMMDKDALLTSVAIRGEISNYKIYPSGHHYFTIKDEGSALRCVMFRGNAMRLKFRPESGMQVVVTGKISVYPRDGAYQLYCNSIILDGVGDLYAAFEQLKQKLADKGLFDPSHKKPIPNYPGTIGIITSSAGAAVHDMLRILRKRYPLTQVRLLPVRVQGAEAPGEIAAAIQYANIHHLADLLIVGRGGGSIEDLWAFNEEEVAWAIYRSEIPVISAVGHEPDVTISDFVADLRAATPSNAAELAVPDQETLYQQMDAMTQSMETAVMRQLKAAKQHLDVIANTPTLQDPCRYIHRRRDILALLTSKLQGAETNRISRQRQSFVSLTAKLDAMSPLKVLTRGYAMVATPTGELARTVKQVKTDDDLTIKLQDGSVTAKVIDIVEEQV